MSQSTTNRRTFLKTAGAAAFAGLAGVRSLGYGSEGPGSLPDEPANATVPDPLGLSEILAVPDAVFRPTSTGCTVHWVPLGQVEARIFAGQQENRLDLHRELIGARPTQVTLDGFPPDSRLYYQGLFRRKGTPTWTAGPLRTIHTARSPGSAFRVALIADSHVAPVRRNPQPSPQPRRNLNQTIDRVLADQPDFAVFLGDETLVTSWHTADRSMDQQLTFQRWDYWRKTYSSLLGAVPSFLALGNHEGEAGYYQVYEYKQWRLQRWGTIARKRYFLNPLPDTYAEGGENEGWRGDQRAEPTGGADEGNCSPLQNYFAWSWGDALFVVLDVHRYTNVGQRHPTHPEQWALGASQLQWLERTLLSNKARWKFVVAHHVVGGWEWDREGSRRSPARGAYGRGGARYARVGEQARITELMKRAGAQFFLYGHDHVFAHQQAEGIHFVCCGRPTKLPRRGRSTPGWKEAYGEASARNPHDFYMAVGYTRLAIFPEQVLVQYVRTGTDPWHGENVTQAEGEVVYQFTVT